MNFNYNFSVYCTKEKQNQDKKKNLLSAILHLDDISAGWLLLMQDQTESLQTFKWLFICFVMAQPDWILF